MFACFMLDHKLFCLTFNNVIGFFVAKVWLRRVYKCITCFRACPKIAFPLMAPLPIEWVTALGPFLYSGVDFCGPILLRSVQRRIVHRKSYITAFVCMSTRAIHLELVSDLTAEAFMAALSKFMSRRGQCSHLYSVNSTNFVGTNSILNSHFAQLKNSIYDFFTNHEIHWHFIPPSTPHFGGLRESAVKFLKRQLTKIVKNVMLNFEELTTLLCKIEAVLNSRPLTPLSDDPSDFSALTPAHFLISEPQTLPV